MEKPFELAYTELKKGCFPEELSFRTTAEIKPLEGVIGQERAVKAFDFGLAVKMKGYNIYMAWAFRHRQNYLCKKQHRKAGADRAGAV